MRARRAPIDVNFLTSGDTSVKRIGRFFRSTIENMMSVPRPPNTSMFVALVWRFFRSSKWQVGVSLAASIAVILFDAIVKKGKAASLVLGDFGAYFGFLAGIGAILILVSSITAVLLVYDFQILKSDENYFYARYRETIADLRTFLDRLHDAGLISRSYDDPYREIELLLNPKELPLAFRNAFPLFIDIVRSELHDRLGTGEEFNWAFYSIATRMAIAEETANGLGLNLIKKIVLVGWVKPVLKTFWSLAALVLAALIAAIHFSGVIVIILNGLAIGIACMTVMLIVEVGLLAIQESRDFFDIRTDTAPSEDTESESAQPQPRRHRRRREPDPDLNNDERGSSDGA
jgi:hypothetical protein